MMVPCQAILTPLYLELNAMRLTDSLLGLVLFNTTVNLPFGVFVMRNAFLASSTEFLRALTFLTRDELYTLPVSLVNLQAGSYGSINFGYLVAGSVIAMVPCIVLYVALQRYCVSGIAVGAVKG
ncbi:MAG: hypothetical protein ACRDO0_06070 [Nocardioidaceae bacterium]